MDCQAPRTKNDMGNYFWIVSLLLFTCRQKSCQTKAIIHITVDIFCELVGRGSLSLLLPTRFSKHLCLFAVWEAALPSWDSRLTFHYMDDMYAVTSSCKCSRPRCKYEKVAFAWCHHTEIIPLVPLRFATVLAGMNQCSRTQFLIFALCS